MITRKFKTMIGSVIVGGMLLSLSVTAFAASGTGYESFKEAVKSTVVTENSTMSTQFEVKDNGTTVLSGDITRKHDKENMSSKSSITVDGVSKTCETSTDGGNLIISADGKYYTASGDYKKFGKERINNSTEASDREKFMEILADTFIGDIKNQFVKDGETISLKLEGAQIPEITRLAVSAALENKNHMEDYKNSGKVGCDESMKAMMEKMPKLTNIDIKSIAMTANVEGNTLKENKFTVMVTGKESNGTSHELTLVFDSKITDIGSTKVDSIDVTGKEVKTIDMSERFKRR